MTHPRKDSAADEPGDGSENVQKAKNKLVMDFQLQQKTPERVTIEVLKQMVRERPERMVQAIRRWLHPD